jgi:hypothetical protein
MSGPVLTEVLRGLRQGVNSLRAGSSAFNPSVTTVLPRADLTVSVNGSLLNSPVQAPSPGTAGMFGGHAQQPQRPSTGSAPSNTPTPGK